MKTLLGAALIVLVLLGCTVTAQAQTNTSPKQLLEALATNRLKDAVKLAQTVTDVNYCDKSGATLLMCSA